MMRLIKYTTQFKKDYKREKKSGHKNFDHDFITVIKMLEIDEPLPLRYHDHPLNGEWKDFRDCHIKPDLLLIYSKPDSKTLVLARLGSHSELLY